MEKEAKAAKRRETWRRYRLRHPDRVKAYNDKYYAANKERYLAKRQAQRDADPEGHRARKRKWDGKPTPTRPCPPACECCGRPPGAKALHLDHCHTTGQFRGWLCDLCNRGVGMLGDNLEGVMRMVAYLRGQVP